jgi:hypothetical protein
VDQFTLPINYVNAPWDPNIKVPYKDKRPPNQRTLPGDGAQYPYLTISDFLEDTIVQMPFGINTDAFFDGNIESGEDKGYLLPLKNLFFEFFTTTDLRERTLSDGKKMLELKANAGGIKATLRIPIKGNQYIEYNRLYFNDSQPNANNNTGALVEKDFVFALFPNIKFANNRDAYYRLGLVAKYVNNYDVKCFLNNNDLLSNMVIRNALDNRYDQCKNFILEQSNFDFIRIDCGNNQSGIIIPTLKQQAGTSQYTFAVDFGTTNIHVEYSVDNTPAKPLDISTMDNQLHLLLKVVDISRRLLFAWDMIPAPEPSETEIVGPNAEFKFPMRTVLSEAANTNWNAATFPIGHVNIPLPYEKKEEKAYNRITTGLKWSNEPTNMKKIQSYIESLFLILRNKVILNNGNLSQTKIIWFYPISMTQFRFNLFKQAWDSAYKKYFGANIQHVRSMTESVAPYEFYKRAKSNASDMVTVDIGGGTSDIVIAQNEQVKYITSFRFAANSIFGDGYASNQHGAVQNGIVRQFKNKIYNILNNNQIDDLLSIYTTLDQRNISTDIASFFFSLKNNKDVIQKHIADDVDFNKMLQVDDKQKIVFIFFYAAIIYHLAHIMKAKNMPMPRHIAFSGNGSRVIQILTTDNSLLVSFTKLIFENIYRTPYDNNGLGIIHNQNNPKEVTCKGGISSPNPQNYQTVSGTKVVLSNNQSFISNETYRSINQEDYICQMTKEASNFVDFVIRLNDVFPYKNRFGISNSSFDIAKQEGSRDLETYARKGLTQKLAEVSLDDLIEETFFFYPLNGMLHALCNAIYESTN